MVFLLCLIIFLTFFALIGLAISAAMAIGAIAIVVLIITFVFALVFRRQP